MKILISYVIFHHYQIKRCIGLRSPTPPPPPLSPLQNLTWKLKIKPGPISCILSTSNSFKWKNKVTRHYQEKKKKLVVTSSNTIDHPNTMVIHLQNTSLACKNYLKEKKIQHLMLIILTHPQQSMLSLYGQNNQI